MVISLACMVVYKVNHLRLLSCASHIHGMLNFKNVNFQVLLCLYMLVERQSDYPEMVHHTCSGTQLISTLHIVLK